MDQRAHDGWRRVIEGISFHELYRVMARFVSTHRDSHNEGLWNGQIASGFAAAEGAPSLDSHGFIWPI